MGNTRVIMFQVPIPMSHVVAQLDQLTMKSSIVRSARQGIPPTTRAILERGAPEATTVHGWLKSIRAHKNVSFLEISDGTSSTSLQAVVKGQLLQELDG